MKPSPIQLTDYFLTQLRFSANPQFHSKDDPPVRFEDFQVIFEAAVSQEGARQWQLSLKLEYQPPAEANVPYRFSAEMIGFAIVHPEYPEDRIERLVKTNGASMLFGALREVIRDTTARGPFSTVILPSTSFYESQKKSESAPPPAEEPPKPIPEPPTPES